jgi:hypothetical protein
MRLAIATYLVLAGCGDNAHLASDAAPPARPDAPPRPAACLATFAGNFAETISLAADCAMLSGHTLAFAVPSQHLDTSIAIQLDLGAAPEPGMSSSETVASWSEMATQMIGNAKCIYIAGATAVPPGNFTITLDALDVPAGSAHGDLALELAVLPGAETNCGPSNMETLDLVF